MLGNAFTDLDQSRIHLRIHYSGGTRKWLRYRAAVRANGSANSPFSRTRETLFARRNGKEARSGIALGDSRFTRYGFYG